MIGEMSWGVNTYYLRCDPLVGKPGIVQDRFAASAYIRVRGELRQAEVVGGGPLIVQGETFKVGIYLPICNNE